MRPIKFRIFSTKTNVMIHWDELSGGMIDDIIEDDNWKVMQFTGLHDKNGKEIYEGDIVKAWHHEFEEEWIYPVVYEAPVYTLGKRRYWKDGVHDWYSMEQFESFEMEVIGNIHEHGELLE